MDRIKLYTDEHVSKAVLKGLRFRGIDVESCQEAGLRTASDQEHFLYAHTQQRVIFTKDDDFLKLHAAGEEHAGIIYTSQQTPIGDIIKGVMLIWQVLDQHDMQNHVEYI